MSADISVIFASTVTSVGIMSCTTLTEREVNNEGITNCTNTNMLEHHNYQKVRNKIGNKI